MHHSSSHFSVPSSPIVTQSWSFPVFSWGQLFGSLSAQLKYSDGCPLDKSLYLKNDIVFDVIKKWPTFANVSKVTNATIVTSVTIMSYGQCDSCDLWEWVSGTIYCVVTIVTIVTIVNIVTNVIEKKNQLTLLQRSDQLLQSRMISGIGLVWLIHKVHDFQCNSLVQPTLHCFSNKTQQHHQSPLQCYWSGSTFPWLTEVGSNPLGTCK